MRYKKRKSYTYLSVLFSLSVRLGSVVQNLSAARLIGQVLGEQNLMLEVLKQNTNNGVKRSPVLCTGLSAFLTLPYLFLFTRFPLCWAFLFSRLILFWMSWLFWHTIKFKINELFTPGSGVFLPVLQCCAFRSGNCTATISKQRYAYKGKYHI